MDVSIEACWSAIERRDKACDAAFVYAVRSTGIYCRPSCPSRRARRDHVVFFTDCETAERAGYRACKRCDPGGRDPAAGQIADACRAIQVAERAPTLATLAAAAGYSPAHFHRLFKARTGLTPRAYAAGLRAERVRQVLASGADVTTAIYAAGYNAASRFYADAPALLGMSPRNAGRGGAGEQISYAHAQTRLGQVLAAATTRGLCAVLLGDHADVLTAELRTRFPAAHLTPNPDLGGLLARVVALIEQGASGADLPLDLRGTTFQVRVWHALRDVPAGQTVAYAAIANTLGAPHGARAVARACAANTLALVVPCHRVVRSDGALAGYRWGVARKQALLDAERAQNPAEPAITRRGATIGPIRRTPS